MRVTEICNRGKFNSVYIEGFILPIYDNIGIEIKDGESLEDSLNSLRTYGQGISKVRLNIVGESQDEKYNEHRKKLGLTDRELGDKKRYCIGYVDVLIIKSDTIMGLNTINKGNKERDIVKIVKSDDELELMTRAIDIKNEIAKENDFAIDYSVGIIDKIFINKNFRRLGIASWVHNNIKDLIKIYGMVNISAILLIPGDFTNKAQSDFSMSASEYKDMLVRHYKALGYGFISLSVMCKRLISRPTKYVIGFDN